MTSRTLTVPDIHCGHCASSIEGAVGALAGVDDVKVDI
ncbi:MAG TPA: heavy-metal-associated domain-containing protein, partial [Acidimicrobiia bacterium]|nr:heavy-metal-associated domain-containing protein [Acidimicrobiia bacterium]